MALKGRKRVSHFFVTFFIGLIVVSFMFTGFESMRGTPDTIAQIGNSSVKFREYQEEFNRQLGFYKQIMGGGKDLTYQQIERFKLKDNSIRNLVQRKLLLNLADDLSIAPAPDQVRETIKEMPYWQTNEQFDLEKYKQVLLFNRWSTQEFEQNTTERLKSEAARNLFASFPVSENYLKDVVRFKKMRRSVDIVQINKESLRPFLSVTKQEIKNYLARPDGKARAENLFNDRKSSLSKPEEIRAHHILIKIPSGEESEALKKIEEIAKRATPANFKRLANQHTEDPSGKGNGGSLGWFSRGKMAQEFEEAAFKLKKGSISPPVKSSFGHHLIYVTGKREAVPAAFQDHQNDLTTELIRQEKNDELEKLFQSVNDQVFKALEANRSRQLETLKKRYSLFFQKGISVNKLEGTQHLDAASLETLFASDPKEPFVHSFTQGIKTTLVRAVPYRSKKGEKELTVEEERKNFIRVFSDKLRKDVLRLHEENTKVEIFAGRIP